MSVLVGMGIGSKTSSEILVRNSLNTILENIGDSDLMIAISISAGLPAILTETVNRIANEHKDKFLIFPNYTKSWGHFANTVIDMASDFKWTIFSHDDIQLLSPNLIPTVEKLLSRKRDSIGWISFHDMDYLRGSWAPSIREGFHIDAQRENAWSRRKTHSFHNLPEGWFNPANDLEYLKSLPYDVPKFPVRCHGPFSHFIMIESDKLTKSIKRCEDWCPVSLLIDEDWGLVAMREHLYNVWMPMLKYIHVRPKGGTRASNLIAQYGPFVHRQFLDKWGFPHKAIYSADEIRNIRTRFRGTLIPWSMNRKSFQWDPVR